MNNNEKINFIIYIFLMLLLVRFTVTCMKPIYKELYVRITTGESSLEQCRNVVEKKENPIIEDYINAEYTFYLDENVVKYPEKLIENHYDLLYSSDNDSSSIIQTEIDETLQHIETMYDNETTVVSESQ